jgi:two-component sensor histidine kinase
MKITSLDKKSTNRLMRKTIKNNKFILNENNDINFNSLFIVLILIILYSIVDLVLGTFVFQKLDIVANVLFVASCFSLLIATYYRWIQKIEVLSLLLYVIFIVQFVFKSLDYQSVSITFVLFITFIVLYLLFWKNSLILLMSAIFIFIGILGIQTFYLEIQLDSSYSFFNLILFNCSILVLLYWTNKQETRRLKTMLEQKELVLNQNVTELNEKNEKIELLYNEIQHRIKNNLQVISSLIGLQIHQIEDKKSKEAFYDTKSRIDVMSLLHQELHIEDHSTLIDLKEFISKVTLLIQNLYNLPINTISMDFNIEQKFIPFEQANSIGLIMNELITNSVKYAKPISGILKISILFSGLKELNLDKMLIVYSDNGTKKIDIYNLQNDNLGMKLIRSLINQSKATVKIETENINLYTFKFPL